MWGSGSKFYGSTLLSRLQKVTKAFGLSRQAVSNIVSQVSKVLIKLLELQNIQHISRFDLNVLNINNNALVLCLLLLVSDRGEKMFSFAKKQLSVYMTCV